MLRELTIGRGLSAPTTFDSATRPAQRVRSRSGRPFPCPWPWNRPALAPQSNLVAIPKLVSAVYRQRGKQREWILRAESRFRNAELRPGNVVSLPSLPRLGRSIPGPPGPPTPVPPSHGPRHRRKFFG